MPQGGAEYGERNDERTDSGYIPPLEPKEPEYGKSICASQVQSSVISEKITVKSHQLRTHFVPPYDSMSPSENLRSKI